MTVNEGNYAELKKSYDYAAKRNRELHDKVSDLEFQNMLLRENFKLRNKKDFDPFQEQEIKMKNLQKKFDDLITEKEIWKNDCARITTEEVNKSTKESYEKTIEELKECLKKKNGKIIDLMSEISHLKQKIAFKAFEAFEEKISSPRSRQVTERITEKAKENPVGNQIEPGAFQDEKNKKISEQDSISPEKQREAIEKFKNLPEKEKNTTVEALKEIAATPTKIQSDKSTKEISAGFTGVKISDYGGDIPGLEKIKSSPGNLSRVKNTDDSDSDSDTEVQRRRVKRKIVRKKLPSSTPTEPITIDDEEESDQTVESETDDLSDEV